MITHRVPASGLAGARSLVITLVCFSVWTLTATGQPLRDVTLIAPPLPAPTGRVINVSTEPQLQSAIRSLRSDTTIVVARGTYRLTSTLAIKGDVSRVGIRGATNNRDDVVLVGPGMAQAKYGGAPSGIWTGGGVQGVTIANLTIRDFYQHPIVFNAGTQTPLVHNVHLVNAGQQFIKANPDGAGGGVNNGIVEYSVIEYITTAKNDYTNGIDVHTGAGWIVRHNLFRNLVGPPGTLAGPASVPGGPTRLRNRLWRTIQPAPVCTSMPLV